ncbi:hypothetical protein SAICODRAFT_21246 [Saitoella complicata NRRL Y-17804]|uniref:uncharacterized protein n=1 Tax=Saitoella complicata (strain BCRC 22490 / CBS 7301 / JCM 7358 / NBRC 10748 / NRRL Y-17804) TaxID=698492 RepID=UPI0008679C86|nr:uncharacterized protein SAICODRAFT_21246 [Saitoella complicata NRRL Y-17804]ODQ50899.1 hypothetical protein SAICODRAFT_21246 [Saitoella complicata NRRL Y-17804]
MYATRSTTTPPVPSAIPIAAHYVAQPSGLGSYPSPPSSLPTTDAQSPSTSTLSKSLLTRRQSSTTNVSSPAVSIPGGVTKTRRKSSVAHSLKSTLVRSSSYAPTTEDSAIDDSEVVGSPANGGKEIVRCERCGKGYKHISCLNKHKWEHTPQWQTTSKLLISKHQQVQLLEAASVLVSMGASPSSSPAAVPAHLGPATASYPFPPGGSPYAASPLSTLPAARRASFTRGPGSFVRESSYAGHGGVVIEEEEESEDESESDDEDVERGESEESEEGMFGGMEE